MRISCTKLAKQMIAQRSALQPMFSDSSRISKALQQANTKELTQALRDCCEAYGKDVRCYIGLDGLQNRFDFERWLTSLGCMVSRTYWPGSGVCELKVAYFKAWHWNE